MARSSAIRTDYEVGGVAFEVKKRNASKLSGPSAQGGQHECRPGRRSMADATPVTIVAGRTFPCLERRLSTDGLRVSWERRAH